VGLAAAAVYVLAAGAYFRRGTWRFDAEGIRYEPRGGEPQFLRWADVTRIERTMGGLVLSGKAEKIPVYFAALPREQALVAGALIWQNLEELFADSVEPPSQADVVTEPWVFLGRHCLRAVLVMVALAYLQGGLALLLDGETDVVERLFYPLLAFFLLPPAAVVVFWVWRSRRASFLQRRHKS
jgi:hypothetical protein